MVTTAFFLYSDLNSDVLVHLKSRIRVEIYPLDCVDFQPAADQHHIYAHLDGRYLAFEASEYSYEHPEPSCPLVQSVPGCQNGTICH